MFSRVWWPGIPAAEVSLQCSQGGWFPDAVSQPHQIYHCAGSIIDADRLAQGRLNVGQAELEGAGLKTKTAVGGNAIRGGWLDLGTAICTARGISSVRSCTAAADSSQVIAMGFR
jgi:hypothetical protein